MLFPKLKDMRWGTGFALLVAALVLAVPGGAVSADGPVYEDAPPTYEPPAARTSLRFAGLKRIRSNGRAVVFVRVSGPGRVFAWGRGTLPFRRATGRAGLVRLLVRPRIPLKRYLKRRGKGRIRVNVGFEPLSGEPRTFERPILLKRKRRR